MKRLASGKLGPQPKKTDKRLPDRSEWPSQPPGEFQFYPGCTDPSSKTGAIWQPAEAMCGRPNVRKEVEQLVEEIVAAAVQGDARQDQAD